MYDYFGRTLEQVQKNLENTQVYFKAQKGLILAQCHDWEKTSVEEIISQIEDMDYVPDWAVVMVKKPYSDGLICGASRKELMTLLKMKQAIAKDEETIKNNTKPEQDSGFP